jgi:hypothetical protein
MLLHVMLYIRSLWTLRLLGLVMNILPYCPLEYVLYFAQVAALFYAICNDKMPKYVLRQSTLLYLPRLTIFVRLH